MKAWYRIGVDRFDDAEEQTHVDLRSQRRKANLYFLEYAGNDHGKAIPGKMKWHWTVRHRFDDRDHIGYRNLETPGWHNRSFSGNARREASTTCAQAMLQNLNEVNEMKKMKRWVIKWDDGRTDVVEDDEKPEADDIESGIDADTDRWGHRIEKITRA
jgi:hypothetical protein